MAGAIGPDALSYAGSLFKGNRPQAVLNKTHEAVATDSLILYLPIVLGESAGPAEITLLVLYILKKVEVGICSLPGQILAA